jgi:hypothetical protein
MVILLFVGLACAGCNRERGQTGGAREEPDSLTADSVGR